MTKLEFLCTLEKHIKPLPKEERESAIEYYSSYIDEMLAENIEEEIEKLGNPKHIASRLIAEFGMGEMQRPSYQLAQSKSVLQQKLEALISRYRKDVLKRLFI